MDDWTILNNWAAGVGLLILSGLAAAFSVITWYKSTERQDYSDLDNMYQNFLGVVIQDPKLRDEKEIKQYPNFQAKFDPVKYDAYAYMAFNFCESVFDYTRGKKNSRNRQSWTPAVVTETFLHWRWFFNPQNFNKFDNETRNHILMTIAEHPETFDSDFQNDFRAYVTDKILNYQKLQNKTGLATFISNLKTYVEQGPNALLSQLSQKDL